MRVLSLPSHSQAHAHKGEGNSCCHMGPNTNKTELHEQWASSRMDKYRTFLSTIVTLSNSFLLKYSSCDSHLAAWLCRRWKLEIQLKEQSSKSHCIGSQCFHQHIVWLVCTWRPRSLSPTPHHRDLTEISHEDNQRLSWTTSNIQWSICWYHSSLRLNL